MLDRVGRVQLSPLLGREFHIANTSVLASSKKLASGLLEPGLIANLRYCTLATGLVRGEGGCEVGDDGPVALPAWAGALRTKRTPQRCQAALSTFATVALIPT